MKSAVPTISPLKPGALAEIVVFPYTKPVTVASPELLIVTIWGFAEAQVTSLVTSKVFAA
jgi:hypothetical protein